MKLKFRILPVGDDTEVQAIGVKFGIMLVVILFASINTGNNLLYLVFSTLCGVVVTSWLLSSLSLRKLDVGIQIPDEVYAQEEAIVDFSMKKGHSLLPAQSLSLSVKSGGSPQAHCPYIDILEKGTQKRIQGLFRFPKRGIYPFLGASVTSNYPFGLIKKKRVIRDPRQIRIYPRIFSLEELLKTGSEGMVYLDSVFRGQEGGLLNIRPFVPGDDRRHLHWKASAKTDNLMVKEFAREKGKVIWIHINPLSHHELSNEDKAVFEAGVSVAASLAYHGRSDGLQMILSAPGLRLVPQPDFEHVRTFLNHLAEIKSGGRLLSDNPQISKFRRHDELAIIVDPLNNDVDWGRDAIVLDKPYIGSLLEKQQ